MNPSHLPGCLRSSLALVLGLTLAACSARGVGGGGTTTTDGGTTTQTALSFTCTQFCASLASEPTCAGAGMDTCLTTCNGSLAATPAGCVASANALYACTQTATPACTGTTAFPFAGCMARYSAYVACVAAPRDAGTPPTDSGAPGRDTGTMTADPCADAPDCATCTGRSACGWCAGRCWQGSGSGPTGATCGDSPWAWTSSQCGSTPTPDAGGTTSPACQSCAFSMCGAQAAACSSDSVCLQCIGAPTQACLTNSRFAAVAECACGACAEACGSFCVIR